MRFLQIDPIEEFRKCSWMTRLGKEFATRYSSLIHGIDTTPFPPTPELVGVVKDLTERIRGQAEVLVSQIVYIYYFDNSENNPSTYQKSDAGIWGEKVENLNSPSFYGFLKHPDGSMSIVCLLRKAGFADIDMMQGMIDHFDDLSQGLERELNQEEGSIVFSGVGILPGWINKLTKKKGKIQVPRRVIETNIDKNINSAHFVAQAWKDTFSLYQNEGRKITPVIVGYRGTLGIAVLEILSENFPSDGVLIEKNEGYKFPKGKPGETIFILDLAGGSTLSEYQEYISIVISNGGRCVWMNETYPPPSAEDISLLYPYILQNNFELLHIVGGEGEIVPRLTSAYYGAVPCCMVILGQDPRSVIVRGLVNNTSIGVQQLAA